MTQNHFQTGDIVTAIYKTGKYIGEITNIRENHYLVKIKAVITHPTQGDLHNPKQINVPLFHERRALAFGEQANIPKKMVKLYNGNILDYEKSLRTALELMKEQLQEDNSAWALQSIDNLINLEKEYF
ncbi:kinase-associated lipoprotein B [Cytobacillus sp. Hm23]